VKTPLAPKSNKRKFTEDDESTSVTQNLKKRKFNEGGKFKKNQKESNSTELSDNRLKAFGINPKKFKNKLKYNGKNQQNGNHRNNKKAFQNKKQKFN